MIDMIWYTALTFDPMLCAVMHKNPITQGGQVDIGCVCTVGLVIVEIGQ